MDREKQLKLKLSHKSAILDCNAWLNKSRQLMLSARELKPLAQKYFRVDPCEKPEYEPHLNAFFMLVAFALENALKALIIRKNHRKFSEHIDSKGTFPDLINEHVLLKLAKDAGIPTGNEENKKFLERMSRYAIWAGRYPTPLKPGGIPVPMTEVIDAAWIVDSCYKTEDIRQSENLIHYLDQEWNEAVAQQETGADK